MKSTFNSSIRSVSLLGAAMGVVAPALVWAQDIPASLPTGSDKTSAKDEPEIVVTGTSLRKVAPAGAEQITLDPVAIAATNAISTDQLLSTLPQLNSFGNLQTVSAGGGQLTVNQTNIRNLPQGVGGGSPTLVLMDGHRMVGEGVKQSYPDPDVIPPALIERVEVVTDGGSAVYGSDAVGGVVNFITKRDYNGIDFGIRQGLGDHYKSTDINFTAGKAWDSGDVYVGYNFSHHDPIYASDRSYVKDINYATGLPASQYCSPANVGIGAANYAVNGNALALSNANLCDDAKAGEIYPLETRHSVLAGFRQELGGNAELTVKGYFSQRNDTGAGGPLKASGSVTSSNPNYISTGDANAGAPQTVYFNFGPVGGDETVTTGLRSWGITPMVTWKVGHDFQLRAFYNYGESRTVSSDPQFDSTSLASAVAAGTINPYNIAASNSAALGQVLNSDNYGIGKDKLSNAKVTLDGPIFRLPGGDVRVAVGGEYIHEHYEGTTVVGTYQAVLQAPLSPASRNVKSGFAEINVPVISPSNHFPLVYSLNIAAAERYDSYSDFGGNWAPNIGATLKPVSWIGLRGRWNRAFQAPSLVQLSQAATPTVNAFPGFLALIDPYLQNPAVPVNGGPIVAIQGTVSPLQPERARDYNLGFDISPPMLKGMNVHFTYFNINYSGQIGTPPYGYGPFFGISSYNSLYQMLPSISQVQTFLANAGVPAAVIANTVASINAQGGNAYIVADSRSRNLGISKVHGLDISFDYHHDVSFGSVYASFNSSWTQSAVNAADGVTFTANQAGVNGSAFNAVTMLGATVGENFRGQVTWNHLSGFDLSAPAQLGQTTVGAYNTFDLYTQYDVKRSGLPPITLSLGITNMFDTNPPIYRGNAAGFGAGYAHSTLGRVFQLGANVKF